MITRLTETTEGTIYFAGKDITKIRGKELREYYRNIQMVFQMPKDSFDPRQTLGDGIGEGLRNLGISRREAGKKTEQLLENAGWMLLLRRNILMKQAAVNVREQP